MRTVEDRFNAAMAEALDAGVRIRPATDACCRGCTRDEDILVDGQPAHLWRLFQGETFAFHRGEPVTVEQIDLDDVCECSDAEYDDVETADGEFETVEIEPAYVCRWCETSEEPTPRRRPLTGFCLYFDLDDPQTIIGKAQTAFTEHGLSIQWDGDENTAAWLSFEPKASTDAR